MHEGQSLVIHTWLGFVFVVRGCRDAIESSGLEDALPGQLPEL